MSVPTVISVDPGLGQAQGLTMVRMLGTGFATLMAVTLNGQPATDVSVVSATEAYFVTPRNPSGIYDVVIQNLDTAGVPVAGELASLLQGYEYRRPYLDANHRGIDARICAALVAVMKNDVCPTVLISSAPDFDPDTSDGSSFIDTVPVPAIQLYGPQSRPSKFGAHRRTRVFSDNTRGKVEQRRPRRKSDLLFTLVAIDKGDGAKLGSANMGTVLRAWFDDHGYLALNRDSEDPSKGAVRYPLRVEGGWSPFGEPNVTGVRAFRGTVAVMNVTVEDAPGMRSDTVNRVSGRLSSLSLATSQKE